MPGKRKDLTGKIFGKWSVINFSHAEKGNSFWNCKCKCGDNYVVHSSQLIHGRSTQCKKCSTGFQDLTGKTFGSWKVIELYGYNDTKHYLWLCECVCGSVKKHTSQSLKDGRSIRCRKCNARRKYVGDLSSSIVTRIKYGAKTRSLEFELDINYLWELFIHQNEKCALTGLKISFGNGNINSFNPELNASLDRIDNNKGYIRGNVQWVHKDINIIKGVYPEDYFIKLCNMVYKNKGYMYD